jgi:uncharacterized membrane protein
MTDSPTVPAIIELSRRAVIVSYYTILCTFTLYSLWQLPGDSNAVAIGFLWVIKMVPMMIFAPGLRRRHLRTYAWLSFVVLLYFIQSVQTAFVEDSRLYGIVITLMLSVLFSALVIHIRAYRNFYNTSL